MSAQIGNRIRVFLADDHPLVCQGITSLLTAEGIEVCGEGGSSESILAHPRLPTARVVILDLSLDKRQGNGTDLIFALRRRGLLVVICSMNEDAGAVRRAFAAGATGYVTKREAGSTLIHALAAVLDGKTYASPRAAEALGQDP